MKISETRQTYLKDKYLTWPGFELKTAWKKTSSCLIQLSYWNRQEKRQFLRTLFLYSRPTLFRPALYRPALFGVSAVALSARVRSHNRRVVALSAGAISAGAISAGAIRPALFGRRYSAGTIRPALFGRHYSAGAVALSRYQPALLACGGANFAALREEKCCVSIRFLSVCAAESCESQIEIRKIPYNTRTARSPRECLGMPVHGHHPYSLWPALLPSSCAVVH